MKVRVLVQRAFFRARFKILPLLRMRAQEPVLVSTPARGENITGAVGDGHDRADRMADYDRRT